MLSLTPIIESWDDTRLPLITHRLRWYVYVGADKIYSGWGDSAAEINCRSWTKTWAEHKDGITKIGIEAEDIKTHETLNMVVVDAKEFTGKLEYLALQSSQLFDAGFGRICVIPVAAISLQLKDNRKIFAFCNGAINIENVGG